MPVILWATLRLPPPAARANEFESFSQRGQYTPCHAQAAGVGVKEVAIPELELLRVAHSVTIVSEGFGIVSWVLAEWLRMLSRCWPRSSLVIITCRWCAHELLRWRPTFRRQRVCGPARRTLHHAAPVSWRCPCRSPAPSFCSTLAPLITPTFSHTSHTFPPKSVTSLICYVTGE